MSDTGKPKDRKPYDVININGKKITEALPVITACMKELMDAGLNAWEVLHLVNIIHITMQEIGQDHGESEEKMRTFLEWSVNEYRRQKMRENVKRGFVN